MTEDNKHSVEEAIETVLGEESVSPDVDVESELVDTAEEVNPVDELNNKLAILEEELKVQKDAVVRAQAYAQNEIRKAGIDAESKVKRTLKRFTEALLPVADSLEMAVNHIDKENEAEAKMAEGVELTLKAMIDSFAKVGIVQMNPVGEQANPEKHQIVSQQPIEGKAENEVVVVMQKGYEYNGQVIRPAMVMVASA